MENWAWHETRWRSAAFGSRSLIRVGWSLVGECALIRSRRSRSWSWSDTLIRSWSDDERWVKGGMGCRSRNVRINISIRIRIDEMRKVELCLSSSDVESCSVVSQSSILCRMKRPQPRSGSVSLWISNLRRIFAPWPPPHSLVLHLPLQLRSTFSTASITSTSNLSRSRTPPPLNLVGIMDWRSNIIISTTIFFQKMFTDPLQHIWICWPRHYDDDLDSFCFCFQ